MQLRKLFYHQAIGHVAQGQPSLFSGTFINLSASKGTVAPAESHGNIGAAHIECLLIRGYDYPQVLVHLRGAKHFPNREAGYALYPTKYS